MQHHRSLMRSVDRSWLRMESPENPMMIGVVLAFESQIPLDRLCRVLDERFLCFRRFRQLIVRSGGRLYWQDDPSFDLDNHLHITALPGKADRTALQHMASDLNSTPLDISRPLWQIHYVDNYNGGCALIVRIHHCIADGISLVRVLLALTDDQPGPKLQSVPSTPEKTVHQHRTRRQKLNSVYREVRNSATTAVGQVSALTRNAREKHGYPLALARTASRISIECLKLGLTPADPPTALKGGLSGRKEVAWADPLPLQDAKDIARALKGTVNDVLMTAATGAIYEYLKEQNQRPPECGVRVAVPFNLRPLNQPIETLGNQFGLVLVPLPVDVESPKMRFRQVQDHMNRMKRSWQAQITYSLLDLFGRGPDIIERRAIDLLSQKASAVLTNVPGPKKPVYLAGIKLTEPMCWVPQTGGIGIGMSIFSYADQIQFGIIVDKKINLDANKIMAAFGKSFADLREAAGSPRTYPEVERRKAV